MALTVREFIYDMYRLINPSNPTQALHGDDMQLAIRIMNRLLQSYASSGLMITISKTVTVPLSTGVKEVIFTDPDYVPPFDPTVVQIAQGRLANISNAWLQLSGVTYPLIDASRDYYLSAWKYEPLQSLPRFIVLFPEVDLVRARLFGAASQFFDFFCRGKFQLPELTADDDMSIVPQYSHMYLSYAVGNDVCLFKGREAAWTERLEHRYRELKDEMEAASEVNLSIVGQDQSLLNGAWRVKAGI